MEDIEPNDIERERSEDYYRGIADALEYALGALETGFRGNVPPEALPAMSVIYELMDTANEHRRHWFRTHMNARMIVPFKAEARAELGP